MCKWAIVLLAFSFACCTAPREKNLLLADMPSVPVKGDILTSDLMAYHTMQSAYIQSHLFYFTPSDNEVCLVINAENGEEVGTFARVGNGPGELDRMSVYSGKSSQGDTIYMFDRNHTMNLYILNIDNHHVKYDFIRSVPVEERPNEDNFKQTLINMQRLDNGYYVGQNLIDRQCLFSLYDKDLKFIRDFGNFPLSEVPGNLFFLAPFEGPFTACHNSVYYATRRFGYMARYDISERGEISQVWENTYSEANYQISNGEIKFKKANLHGFLDMAIGKDYIFALYSGIPCGNMFVERSVYAIEPKTLVVLRQDGGIVGKYAIESPSNTLCLSDDEKYLYVKTSHPDIAIERFKVKDLTE